MVSNYNETNIFQGFSTILQASNLKSTRIHHELITQAVIEGMATFLRDSKSTESPSCITITDFKGNVMLSAYCKYMQPSGDEDQTAGSWAIDFTFNKSDIPDKARITDIKEPACFNAFRLAADKRGFEYYDESHLITVVIAIIRSIVDWLDTNGTESEVTELVYPGLFKISVGVEDGIKIMGMVIEEEVKGIVKGSGDEILSKANLAS